MIAESGNSLHYLLEMGCIFHALYIVGMICEDEGVSLKNA